MYALEDYKKNKCIDVRVTTMDADLEFKVEPTMVGRDLFDLVCRTIGLREVWFFGLQYTSTKGYCGWMHMKKKISKQDIKLCDGRMHLLLLVKYYPEIVEDELIQNVTRHLFFLQVKQSILTMDVYCRPEACVLLASYAVQAKYGDFDDEISLTSLEELLPNRVISQYQMTPDMWQDRIKVWWMNNKGMSRQDAEIEYLKIAQDLDMYGIQYFPIYNKKDSDLWLGISALGVHMYEKANKLIPKTTFAWSEIKNISFKDKKFSIKTMDGSSTVFWSQNIAINQVILDLCVGSHNLFLRRRQPDSVEVQQMKVQAKEERLRKQEEHNKLEKEKAARLHAERDRDRLQSEVTQLTQQLQAASEALRRTEETAELLAEKARISEEEALVLAKRASEAEAAIQRIRISAIKTEEEKILMERKAREAELIANRMLDESDRRTKEAERLKCDLFSARHAEKNAKAKLLSVMGDPYEGMEDDYPQPFNGFGTRDPLSGYPPDPRARTGYGNDLKSLSAEIEKERVEYLQKSKHLQEQLSDLRSEIEGLKVGDQTTHDDINYDEINKNGDDKYSTLKKSGSGSTKARIQLFDGL